MAGFASLVGCLVQIGLKREFGGWHLGFGIHFVVNQALTALPLDGAAVDAAESNAGLLTTENVGTAGVGITPPGRPIR